ncbi:FAD-dependent monooxygenase [Pusillimonas sp. CC-YST705]|uniref:FAD-dependent monooxygenase n=1 Tax=Mesopusillimonas faecipullorum TaxID=2755040 RepID=A0ABS8CGX7_9BURK|nr:FAD-dependent monooxygenase [Mesopusillimonas faecipullorum]MCB5364824.1 FAD-dependent monooxygenase [Mesopusillimonas faecipullorum]
MTALKIGIAGAGIGGLTAAIALHQQGHNVTVLEQAPGFLRVGADINLTPNAVKALDGVGVGQDIRRTAARPTHRISRQWDTGEETSRLAMSSTAEEKYGAPQLTLHRPDLLAALAAHFPSSQVRFDKKVSSLQQEGGQAVLQFTDGTHAGYDVLVGADGIHSAVRKALWGEESPRFTGIVAFRAVVPVEKVAHVPNIQAFTKWWGPVSTSQIVTFPLNQGKDIFIFATIGQDSWHLESWTTQGSVEEFKHLFADFHPDATALLNACDEVLKTALYERDPMAEWGRGLSTLLGDACHPMLPFMAQGAGMAIEDAIVLSRALEDLRSGADVAGALRRYEATRKPRTAEVQLSSRGNNWLKQGGNGDWVYGYDAWTVPLADA